MQKTSILGLVPICAANVRISMPARLDADCALVSGESTRSRTIKRRANVENFRGAFGSDGTMEATTDNVKWAEFVIMNDVAVGTSTSTCRYVDEHICKARAIIRRPVSPIVAVETVASFVAHPLQSQWRAVAVD
eukprot:SAG31_NODE_6265_length_2096_cov_1.728092_1_plen_134_part_00